MPDGVIIKALSGFYYVRSGEKTIECKARGRFRHAETSPLVGDHVQITADDRGKGVIEAILPRKNAFVRPAVANIDLLVVIAAAVIPITDPYLIDRVAVIAEHMNCGVLLCINKADLDPGDHLFDIYATTGYPVIRTSAVTGLGMDELRDAIRGRTCAFTGNSGVGKSSILNGLDPAFHIQVGDVSEKLGRGKHTTRHVELFSLGENTYIADTPGFASFDVEQMEPIRKEDLQYLFPEFRPYLGACRFHDCAHLKEPGCAVLDAVSRGKIHPSRHAGYARLYDLYAQRKDWELK